MVTSGKEGRGNIGVGEREVQTIAIKQATRIYCTIHGIQENFIITIDGA